MATKLLYLYDSYLKEFEAKGESVNANQAVLDQSAFHPLTGGVGCDLGWLVKGDARFRVVRVEIDRATKVVSHLLDAEPSGLSQGDVVEGMIDWDPTLLLDAVAYSCAFDCGCHVQGLQCTDYWWTSGCGPS